ncbi:type VII secretion integral membrane protein EccD [Mycobacterium xenopi 3993]|nr:type VII secretion integral membrane protein EccD [Mycobacterium xenopi 3993]
MSRARSPRTGVALSIAALAPIATALSLAVPGKFGPAQIMLGAAGVAAWSLISLILPTRERERAIAFFTATAVLGTAVLLAAGAELLWQLPLLSIGCGLIVAALLVTIQAAQLSALCARFPLPVIPAPGIPHRRRRRRRSWRTCRGGCASATRTRTASSPPLCCLARLARW